MQIKKLQGYLRSKAHYQKRRRWTIGLAIALVMAAVLLIIAHATYMPMAKQLSDNLFVRTQAMVNFDGINSSAYNIWLDFLKRYSESKVQEDKDECHNLFLNQLALLEKETDDLFDMIKKDKIEIAEFYFPILWMHGINSYDVAEIDSYTSNCFDELYGTFEKYKETASMFDDEINMLVPQIITPYLSMVKLDYMTNHTIVEAYYYTYLMILTHLPKSTHEKFYKMSLKWENMPKTGLGLSDKEYERLMNMSYEKCDQQLNEIQRLQEEAENLLDIINAQLESILKDE